MIQKLPARPRGRPRAYDPDAAMAQATAVFWDAGYAATSLDDLTAGTGMNRPSLYGAFGDKHALYSRTLERYRSNAAASIAKMLAGDGPVRDAFARLYAGAIALYLAGAHGARGCYLIGTAVTEAVRDPQVRATLGAALQEIDTAFAARIRSAQLAGELPDQADALALAKLATAVLNTLAIRARAGESRQALEGIAVSALDLLFPAQRR